MTDFDHLVLGAVSILGEGDAGEIRRVVEGNWRVPQSTVNSALTRLQEQGLIKEAVEKAQEGSVSYRSVYTALIRLRERGLVERIFVLWSITEAGRFALAEGVE